MNLTNYSNTGDIEGSPSDLAKEVGSDGIVNILNIVCRAYESLYSGSKVTPTMSEIDITEEFYVKLQCIWRKSSISLIPFHEKPDPNTEHLRGKPPTIDFCFRDELIRKSYFGFECKLLKENPTSYNEYVNEGVNRYLKGKYSANCSVGSMIGYITLGNPTQIVKEVKNRVDEVSDISNMQLSYPINEFREHYESKHTRSVGLSPFFIHHLFFYFA